MKKNKLFNHYLIAYALGDDLDNDYWGARAMCWNSLLLDRWGGGYTIVPEEHVIENIMDVFNKTSLD